ncbi:MAG: LytR C-terminal domain-containing protein [Solirubrobacterales bacterium]|nr:LytR C-terminal domain-containing protein [Solirubrobacterales bacterium]MBV9471770.1 LytR C-terminal domain-containing protein [Solirubrobacterales bacterium]
MPLPFAFSVHHFINSVGADAGFAAIIGLAILVLLYFAQARETASLREQAYEASQHVHQLEGRVSALAQLSRTHTSPGTVAPRPAPAPPGVARVPARAVAASVGASVSSRSPATGAVVGAGVGPAGEIPAPPAGVGAPALRAATRLIPVPDDTAYVPGGAAAVQAAGGGQPDRQTGRNLGATASANDRIATAGAVAAERPAPEVARPPAVAAHSEAGSPAPVAAEARPDLSSPAAIAAPATAAGAANGANQDAIPAPRSAGALAVERTAPSRRSPGRGDAGGDGGRAAGTGGTAPEAAPSRPDRAGTIPPGTARAGAGTARTAAWARPGGGTAGAGRGRTLPPYAKAQPKPSRSLAGRGLLALLAAIGVAAVVAALLIVTSSGGGNTQVGGSSTPTTNAPATGHKANPAAVNPATVTVAVLNGTSTSNLAHRIALRLGGVGYKQGTIATASDQTQTATVVGYLPGHRRDALAVASTLKLGPASVQPVAQSNQAVACPAPSPCAATVVVTVGADLASTA